MIITREELRGMIGAQVGVDPLAGYLTIFANHNQSVFITIVMRWCGMETTKPHKRKGRKGRTGKGQSHEDNWDKGLWRHGFQCSSRIYDISRFSLSMLSYEAKNRTKDKPQRVQQDLGTWPRKRRRLGERTRSSCCSTHFRLSSRLHLLDQAV